MLSICRAGMDNEHYQLACVSEFADAVVVAEALAKRHRCEMLIVRGMSIAKIVKYFG